MLKYADILSSCFAHQECRQKDVERLLKSHGRQGLRRVRLKYEDKRRHEENEDISVSNVFVIQPIESFHLRISDCLKYEDIS